MVDITKILKPFVRVSSEAASMVEFLNLETLKSCSLLQTQQRNSLEAHIDITLE